jgi:hypothetical protein
LSGHPVYYQANQPPIMPSITNDYTRCEMLNLASAPGGRGPFVIRQHGSAPDSMTLQQEVFLLRNDGVWVLNFSVFALTEDGQKSFMYDSAAQVVQALEMLQGDPVVEGKLPEGVSREELLAGAERTASRLLGALRNAKAVPMP